MEKARNLAALLGVSSNWLNDGMGEMKPSSHANKQGKAQETGTPSANEPRPTEYHDPPIIEEVVAMMRLLDELGQSRRFLGCPSGSLTATTQNK